MILLPVKTFRSSLPLILRKRGRWAAGPPRTSSEKMTQSLRFPGICRVHIIKKPGLKSPGFNKFVQISHTDVFVPEFRPCLYKVRHKLPAFRAIDDDQIHAPGFEMILRPFKGPVFSDHHPRDTVE